MVVAFTLIFHYPVKTAVNVISYCILMMVSVEKKYRTKNCAMAIDAKLFCARFGKTNLSLSNNIANNTALLADSTIFHSDIPNLNSMHRPISSSSPLCQYFTFQLFLSLHLMLMNHMH